MERGSHQDSDGYDDTEAGEFYRTLPRLQQFFRKVGKILATEGFDGFTFAGVDELITAYLSNEVVTDE